MARPYRAFRLCHGASGTVELPGDYSWMVDASGDRVFTDDLVTPAVDTNTVQVMDDYYEPSAGAGLYQTTAAAKGVLVAAAQNGLNVVRFSGNDSFMSTTGPEGNLPNGTSLTKMVLAMVIKNAGPALAEKAYLAFTDTEGAGANFVYIKDGDDTASIDVYVDGGYQWTDIPFASGSWKVVVVTFDADAGAGGEWDLYMNGVSQGVYAGGAGMFQAFAEKIWMFTGFHGIQNGDLAQAAYYEDSIADLSDVPAKAATVSAALMAKWGIS